MPVETASRPGAPEALPSPASPSLPALPFDPLASPPVQFDLGFSRSQELEHVRERVEVDDRGKWDTVALRQELSWRGGRLVLPDACAAAAPLCLCPSPWATSQLCQQLGMPARYFRACPPHLQEAQFAHWAIHAMPRDEDGLIRHDLLAEREHWLLRGKGGALRGVLSARYARLDNRQLLECLLPLVDERFQVSWHAITPESFHLRLVDPALSQDVLPGDRLLVGLHVANSEVGKRSVSVDAIVFRLLCSNGLIRVVGGKGLLRQRHVSFDPPRFRERLSRAISRALVEGAAFLSRLVGTTRVPVPDVEGALLLLGERWHLSLRTRQMIKVNLLAMPAGQQETLWSLVNSITQSAQTLPPDERYALEALAGGLAEHGPPKADHKPNGPPKADHKPKGAAP
ncbi:MAG: hypothetical protein JO250_20840 [Armatimonadetes bacterium]|nr:hypothetical protein [Armatimonadota bacterium]